MHTGFSDYIVFIDESGDHNLQDLSPEYPVFVLAFCLFRIQDYVEKVCPAIQRFKFKYWGHDSVVLHEKEIRKPTDDYHFLSNGVVRGQFMEDLSGIMADLPVTIIASVIDKPRLVSSYSQPANPYHLSLNFGMERVYYHLRNLGQTSVKTHFIVEARGGKEDQLMKDEFIAHHICPK